MLGKPVEYVLRHCRCQRDTSKEACSPMVERRFAIQRQNSLFIASPQRLIHLMGAVLLFLAFQATSSDVKIITTSDGGAALCAYGRALIVQLPGGGIAGGLTQCPNWGNDARAVAVVNIEHPIFVTVGFILTA